MLTCVMLVLALIYLLKPISQALSIWKGVSITAVIISLAPLLYGLHSYSLVGGVISAMLIVEYFVLKYQGKE